VSIGITSTLLVAYLPPASRDELFGGGRGLAAGVWAPQGRARRVPGGVVVSGQWAFCSGITHADVLFAGCVLEEKPAVVALPTDQLRILDTWHTLGLRGTGSHDSVADEVFVPDERVLSIFDGPVIDRPLYRFPPFGFFAACITAAAMGNARAAIDNFVDLASTKKGAAGSRTLAERSTIQAAVATAESALEAARAGYYQAIDEAWRAAEVGPAVSLATRTRLRLAATHGARVSADVVRSMYDLAGGSAIYDGAPLQRRLRDAFTATAHFQVNEASRELPGRILLGQASEAAML
jgi:alkylation response protein AidB-like acyl-CoA dehydrogenase